PARARRAARVRVRRGAGGGSARGQGVLHHAGADRGRGGGTRAVRALARGLRPRGHAGAVLGSRGRGGGAGGPRPRRPGLVGVLGGHGLHRGRGAGHRAVSRARVPRQRQDRGGLARSGHGAAHARPRRPPPRRRRRRAGRPARPVVLHAARGPGRLAAGHREDREIGPSIPTAAAAPPSNRRVTDAALVERARAGDAEAFGELVDRHRDAVFRAALAALRDRAEADDAAQDAFLLAYRRLSTFRGESSFRTWILSIAWRAALDRRRSWRRWWGRVAASPRAGEDAGAKVSAPDPTPEAAAASA